MALGFSMAGFDRFRYEKEREFYYRRAALPSMLKKIIIPKHTSTRFGTIMKSMSVEQRQNTLTWTLQEQCAFTSHSLL